MDIIESFNGLDEDTIIRCPICRRKAQWEYGRYCKHFQGSTWDGQLLYEGPLEEEYGKAWQHASDLLIPI